MDLSRKVEQCRICHDEDDELNMEAPCSCKGTLMFAHRPCVQKWCNQKGNTVCEICLQPFEPGYTASSHEAVNDFRFFIPTIPSDEEFINDNFLDDHPIHYSSCSNCCRMLTMIFILLLSLRHTLPFVAGEYSASLAMLLALHATGVLLPVFLIVKAFSHVKRRRNQRDNSLP